MCEIRRKMLPLAALLLLVSGLQADAQTTRPAARPQKPEPKMEALALGQTWVRTGFFNEIDQTRRTTTTINEPAIVRFLWGTTLKSDEGFWRLRRRGAGNQYSMVATGTATNGTGGRFDIDLKPYLPNAPPVEPALYHLEVIARNKSKTDKSSTTSAGQVGSKIAAQELGAWSPPVVITYAISSSPTTKFDIGDVYRKATLVLDKIVLVADQDGPGREEYHVAGFIQELQRSCSGAGSQNCPFSTTLAQRRFGPYRRTLNPPAEAPFGSTFDIGRKPPIQKVVNSFDFALGTGGNRVTAQRRFVVAISLIEEDAGASIGDWNAAIGQLSEAVKEAEIFGFSKEDVTEYLTEHAGDAIRYVADGLQILSSIADIGAAVPFVGTGIAIAAHVVVAIFEDMADDYYGTRAAYLTLESNLTTEIHRLPGALVGAGADRKYVLRPQRLQFKGPKASNAAAAFDGIVEIEFHWEFSGRAPQ